MNYQYYKMPELHTVRIDPENWRIVKWCKGKRTTAIQNYCCFPFQATGTVPVGNIISDGEYLAKDERLSTIWLDGCGNVGVGKTPPKCATTAVSGIPLIIEGNVYTLDEAMAEGWDTSPLYDTTHSMLAIGDDGYLYYYVFKSVSSGASATWKELVNVAKLLEHDTVLLGDGGGSTVVDIEGENVIASDGNRQLAALMLF